MADEEQDILIKEKILEDLEAITVLFELEEAGKRHPVFAKVKKHLIDLVQGDPPVNTMDQKPTQLKELKRLVRVMDDVKRRDEAAYMLVEVVYRLALDAHHSKLLPGLAQPVVKYVKLLMKGGETPEVPEFGDPHLNLVSRELCGFLKQITTEYEKRIGSAATDAFKMIQAGEHEYHNKPDQHTFEPVYELAVLAEMHGSRRQGELKDKEVKSLRKRVNENYGTWMDVGLFGLIESALVLGFGLGFSKAVPEATDYFKVAITAASALPLAFLTGGILIAVDQAYHRYIKRKE